MVKQLYQSLFDKANNKICGCAGTNTLISFEGLPYQDDSVTLNISNA